MTVLPGLVAEPKTRRRFINASSKAHHNDMSRSRSKNEINTSSIDQTRNNSINRGSNASDAQMLRRSDVSSLRFQDNDRGSSHTQSLAKL